VMIVAVVFFHGRRVHTAVSVVPDISHAIGFYGE
jgi:hypothetical protein